MIGLGQLGLTLSTPVRSSGGGGPTGTFPFAPGTIGFETDWIFTGDWSWDAGTSSIRINGSAGSATLTGAALTAFNAAISNSTGYDGFLTAAGFVTGGQINAALKGGSPILFEFEDNGTAGGSSTSGSGSGLVFSVETGPADLRLTEFTLSAS